MRILAAVAAALSYVTSQDTVGSTGCTRPACVFANARLRFGTGSETSVNNVGLFQQPWYYSQISSAWYQLTFSNYPLDTAIGTGTGSAHWSGTTILDLYSLAPSASSTDYSNFIVDSSDASKTIGHGSIVSTRLFTINGHLTTIQNTFSLGATDSFVKVITRILNNSTATLQNVYIWAGTRDDYVGTTDVNMKTRGNLIDGSFVAITSNAQQSRAIMISNANEGVLFYSDTAGVMTAYALCCQFSNTYNVNPLTLAPSTPSATDGSYAAVLAIGNVAAGSSASIVWYYAAGAISSLSAVAQSVAVAAGAVAVAVTPTSSANATFSRWPMRTVSPWATLSGSGSSSGSGSPSSMRTWSGSLSTGATWFPSGSATAEATATSTPTLSATPTPSVSLQSAASAQMPPPQLILENSQPNSAIYSTTTFTQATVSPSTALYIAIGVVASTFSLVLVCVVAHYKNPAVANAAAAAAP